MEMHPAVAFGAALAGAAIGGLLWAFLAIPFAATIQATASIWLEHHEVLESEFTKEQEARARAKKRREKKEHRSLGERAGGWLRSSRGWLRRGDHDEGGGVELELAAADGVVAAHAAVATDGTVASADAVSPPVTPASPVSPAEPPVDA
jgi:hypothetical protein